jgi:thymidylate synthase
MNNFEGRYLDLVSSVIKHGASRLTRNGLTRSIFGSHLAIHDLEDGHFPILTTRKMYLKGVWGELAAFIRGADDLQTFKDFGCNYWDDNAKAWDMNEDEAALMVGRIYGVQWRNFCGAEYYFDQLTELVKELKENPSSRRHVLSSFNPADVQDNLGCLPPCHLLAQFNVRNNRRLDCIVYMRSVDLCLGLPSDIVLYATLLILLANECGYKPGSLMFMMGDTHVYENHIEEFRRQARRPVTDLPMWKLEEGTKLFEFYPRNIFLDNYEHHDQINFIFNV